LQAILNLEKLWLLEGKRSNLHKTVENPENIESQDQKLRKMKTATQDRILALLGDIQLLSEFEESALPFPQFMSQVVIQPFGDRIYDELLQILVKLDMPEKMK